MTDSTILAFYCSVCEETYPTQQRCQQHGSQPRSQCNWGRQPHDFTTPVPIRVRIENTRVVGGQVSRHVRSQDGGDGGSGRPGSSSGGGRVHAEAWSPEELGSDEEQTNFPGI